MFVKNESISYISFGDGDDAVLLAPGEVKELDDRLGSKVVRADDRVRFAQASEVDPNFKPQVVTASAQEDEALAVAKTPDGEPVPDVQPRQHVRGGGEVA